LTGEYEYNEEHSDCDGRKVWDLENLERKILIEFFLNSKNGEALFHWTWKRRGCYFDEIDF